MIDSTPLPTHMVYYMENGILKQSKRYGPGYADLPLPDNYALFYPKKVGGFSSPNMVAKIFIIKEGSDGEIKEFPSSRYGNNPKILRDAVESYIKDKLSQQTITTRKRKLSKIKSKRNVCKCKK